MRQARWLVVLVLMVLVSVEVGAAEELLIIPLPATVQVGQEVTFQFTPFVRREGDAITFDFGDGGSGSVVYSIGCGMIGGCKEIKHTFAGAGVFTVTGTGTANGVAVSGSVEVTITELPQEQHYWVCTGAHQPGYNNTIWRTDLEVHNPGSTKITYRVSLLKRDTDNRDAETHDFTLHPGRSAHHGDILFDPFGFEGAAALRVTPSGGPLLVHSRTYNQVGIGSYGQFVPGLTNLQAVRHGIEGRLVGLFHDPGLTRGFRTNLGFVNASPAPIAVELSFYVPVGTQMGTRTIELKAYEHKQVNRAYEMVTQSVINGGFILARTTTVGGSFFVYASMVDNVTGDPIYIPAVVMPANAPTAP